MKRQINTSAFKFKYLANSNDISVTQLNLNKRVKIGYNDKYNTIELIQRILDKIDKIVSYNVVIDNTQNKYYLINFVTSGYDIPDLTQEIKSVAKKLKQKFNRLTLKNNKI